MVFKKINNRTNGFFQKKDLVSLGSKSTVYIVNSMLFFTFYWFASFYPELLSHALLHDDSFYYFKIADNLSQGLGFTFSGKGQTTGFHPLWLYVLFLVKKLSLILYLEVSMIQISIFLSYIMSNVFIYINMKIFQNIMKPIDATISCSVLLLFCYRFLYDGMESGLVLILLSIMINGILSRSLNLSLIALAFMVWARIDIFQILSFAALTYSLILLLAVPSYLSALPRILHLHVSGILSILVSYFLRNIVMPEQVSSMVKKYWFELSFNEHSYIELLILAAKRLLAGAGQFWWPLDLFGLGYFANSNSTMPLVGDLIFGILTLCLFCYLVAQLYFNSQIKLNNSASIFLTLCLASGCYLSVHAFIGSMSHNWQWYLAFPSYIMLVTLMYQYGMFIYRRIHQLVALSFITIFFMVHIMIFCGFLLSPTERQWRHFYQNIVTQVDRVTDEKAVIGTWAAGHIGYFSKRTVVNLEGLVEDTMVLQSSMGDDITPVLQWFGITHIITKFDSREIEKVMDRVKNGEGPNRNNLRIRVFKDLDWEPVYEDTTIIGREFSIVSVAAKKSLGE